MLRMVIGPRWYSAANDSAPPGGYKGCSPIPGSRVSPPLYQVPSPPLF